MQQEKLFSIIVEIVAIIAMILAFGCSADAQAKFKLLHTFQGTGIEGKEPGASVIFDSAGNLYSTTCCGGAYGNGVVFKLSPVSGKGWGESVLYSFCSQTACLDGAFPNAGLIIDNLGSNLYGTTVSGGSYQLGAVFKLTPNSDGSWTETVLHSFTGGDGSLPYTGLTMDIDGNLYGTTAAGGGCPVYGGCGVVYMLSPNFDGTWTETVLHSFAGVADGLDPEAGLIIDSAGDLYGSTAGADGYGNVFKLTHNSDGTWTETVLYIFTGGNDGCVPWGNLVLDAAGNLYGDTRQCGLYGNGGVFKLTPNSGGTWKIHELQEFTGGYDGAYPSSGPIFDKAGNLYGTTSSGGNLNYCNVAGCGVVFKLTPTASGRWKETVLHAFVDKVDGAYPSAGPIFDKAGNLYGTANGDGVTTFGSVYEITP